MKRVVHFLFIFLIVFISRYKSQNNWTWVNGSNTSTSVPAVFGTQGTPSSSVNPGTLYAAVTWTDNSGNLWLFGGYRTTFGLMSTMWKYTPSTNQWTWVKGPSTANQYGTYGTQGTAASANNPGARYLSNSWTDNSGNFWLFGGYGYAASTAGYLNDLWKYNPSTNQWTWMKGSNISNQIGKYGTISVTSSTNAPGGRYSPTTIKDGSGNLWLFGGYGYSDSTISNMNDFWKYDISSNNWTWMKGSNTPSVVGVYGTMGVETATNVPGGRRSSVSWTDTNGDMWIFGGYGTISTQTLGLANDLWKYTVSTGNWTWMRGSNAPGSFGWYGSMGQPASNNDPGSRFYSNTGFTDSMGNFWLFGGWGYSASSASRLNDLWRYDPGSNQWTWMKGSSSPNQYGTYGTQGVASPTNNPGTRYLHAAWQDNSGNIWVYGGHGHNSTIIGELGDLWKFDLCNAPLQPIANTPGANLTICSGNTTTLTAYSGTSTIRWYSSATATNVLSTGTAYVTPPLNASGNSSVYTYYAESYSCSANANRTAVNVTVNPTPTISVNSGTTCSGGVFVMLPSGAATYTYSNGSQVVFPTSNSSYTITGTSSQGCASTVQAVSNVTVHPSPVITVNSGSICSGSSFVIVPSGAATYTYSGGTSTVSPATTSFYVVTGTSSLGCVSQMPAVSNVLVYASPTINVNSGAICSGGSFTMNPSGASSYTFSGGSAVVSPSVTSSYVVSGTNSVGCVSSATSTVTVNSLPVITVNSGAICPGNSFTIMPSGASTYTYSSGTPVVSPSVTTSYTVTGTSSAGCTSPLPAVSTITVYPMPLISVNSGSICSGSSFTMVPSGASSYTFSSGSAVVSPTITTSYSVTGTSTAGCVSALPAISTVMVYTATPVSVNSGSICAGNAFTFVPSGAVTYTFSGGSNVVSPSVTTSYSVTGTNSSGCVSSPVVATITVHALPVISVNSGAICPGGSFTIIPSGASTYTYSGGSSIVSPVVTTSYSVSGTSTAGCVSTVPAISNVTVNSAPVISVNSGSICSGKSFTIVPSGAASYTFSGGSAVVSPLTNTSYTVTGTSTAGCISNASAVSNVTVVSLPVVSVNSGSVCAGSSFTLVPSGASSYTYSGGSSVVSPTVTTSYSVTGTGPGGCVSMPAVAVVTVNTLPLVSVNSGSVCAGNSFTIIPAGAASYTISGGSFIVTPTITSTYSITGSSSAGCLSQPVLSSVTVNSLPVISVNSGSICSGKSFTMVPSGAVSYTYSSGSSIVSPTASTSYTVTGTSAAGCVSNAGAVSNVTVYSLPVVTVNSGTICLGNSFTLVPSGASSYTFSSGSAVVSPTATSSYTVTGSSTAGCVSAPAVANVAVSNTLMISVNSGTVCKGSSFTLSPSGAVTYTYSGGSAVVSPTATSSYTVTGTNSSGCISTPAVSTITVMALPVISVNSGAICSGSSFTISPSGAVTYTYSGGSSVVSPSVTSAYSVTGTSSAGCVSAPAISNVTVNAIPVITVNSGSVCSGNSFTMIPSGASTYTYSGGSAIVTPLSNSSYTVTGTSSAGCTSTAGAVSNVTVNSRPVISAGSGTMCLGSSFTIIPSGAASYTFSGGSAIVSPSLTSTYSVTGTGSLGCQSASPAIVTVTVVSLPVITVNSGTICPGATFTLNPAGAASYTYSGGSQTVNPVVTTSYSVTGTGLSGCISATPAIANVVVSNAPVISVNSGSICAGGSFTLIPSGASSYTFSSGSSVVTPSATSSYSVTGTSSFGCVSSVPGVATVTVNTLPVISVNNGTICLGASFTMTPTGASTYTFSSGSAVVSPTANASYSVTGTSSAGCVSSGPAISNVVVTNTLLLSVNSGTTCSGSSFTLIPTGAATYTFSGGSPVVSPTVSTSYSVTGTNSLGCISASPAVANITVMALPVVTVNSGTICSGDSFTIVPSGALTYTYSGGSAIVSPTTNASYSVTGTNASGCVSLPAISGVMVNQPPLITVNSGTVCEGSSFTIVPAGAVSFTFSGGGPVVSPTVTSSYTVTGTSSAGCISSIPAVATITVHSLPVITVNSGTICPGGTFTLNPSGAATYTYSSGSAVVSPTTTTSYSVTGTSSVGCVSAVSAVSNVQVNNSLSLTVNSGTVCSGSSFTIIPSGANSYTFSGGSAVVSPTITTSYSVTGSSAGCTSTVAAISTVSVFSLPVVNVNSGTICAGQSFTMNPSGAANYTYSGGSAIVSPTIQTSYTVTGTDTLGCISLPAIADITVHSLPVISLNSGSICEGSSFTLVPSGALTYTFVNGSSVVTPSITTSYSVNGTSNEGCLSALPGIGTVTVNTLPALNPVSSPSVICMGETASLVASGAASYTWMNNGSPTVVAGGILMVSPVLTSTYSVTGTSNEGCSNTATVEITVSECTGLNNLTYDNGMYVFPNPNSGEFNIQVSRTTEVIIHNSIGQVIYESIIHENITPVSLNGYARGIYFVHLKQGNNRTTVKVLKH
jgi:hypothetical protein